MSSSDENVFRDNPYQSPHNQTGYTVAPAETQGDATGGVIPYKNLPALFAYYLGLFSLLPCIGLFLAIPALVLGIMGLRRRAANPAVKGSVHAWIGIVLGAIFTLVWGAVWVLFIIGMVAQPQQR